MENNNELKTTENEEEKLSNQNEESEENNQLEDQEISENESEEYEEIDTIIEDKIIDEKDDLDIELRDLELKLQEAEIKVDEFEFKYADIEKLDDEKLTEYLELKEEYKQLLKRKKEILKAKKNKLGDDNIEQVSMWIFIYGIIMDILTFPFVAYIVYLNVGSWIIDKLSGLGSLSSEGFFDKVLIWIIVFILPIALIVLSAMLYLNVIKKKIDKKVFAVFGILQALFTLGSIIWLSIALFS